MQGIDCIEISGQGRDLATVGPNRTRREAAGRRILLILARRDAAAAEVLRGVAHYQQAHQEWSVQVDERPRSPEETCRLLAEGWDGAISGDTTAVMAEAAVAVGLPLVALDEAPGLPGILRVRTDDVAVGAMGAECLLDRGFANLAFVGGEAEGWARERRDGFVEAVRLAPHAVALFASPPSGGDGWAGGAVARLANWLGGLPKPLGVMAADDRTALQVLDAARWARLQVPGEIAVLGAGDDVALCELAVPSLSSVSPGTFQQGFLAAERLDRWLGAPASPPSDLRVDPVGVVCRRTTDSLAIPDRIVAAAVRYIAAQACAGATVEQVMRHVGASRSQLERKFRRYLGRSPQAEIRRVQIGRIRQLLADTDLPHKHIAELTGFEYMEYMCVVFRRLTGETMGAYRRARRGGRTPPPESAISARRVA